MLHPNTQIPNGAVKSYKVLPTEIGKLESGMGVVGVWLNGMQYASRALGAATDDDNFLGVVGYGLNRGLAAPILMRKRFVVSATNLSFTDTHSVATVGAVTAPVVQKINSITGVTTTLTAGGAPAAGTYQVVSVAPLSILFDAADAGTVYVSFQALPNFEDAMYGFNGGYKPYAMGAVSSDITAEVPVISQGRIYTNQIILSDAWQAGGVLKIMAGGIFSLSAGTALTLSPVAAKLHAAPTDGYGIGIDLNW